jgi:hypothetical protein
MHRWLVPHEVLLCAVTTLRQNNRRSSLSFPPLVLFFLLMNFVWDGAVALIIVVADKSLKIIHLKGFKQQKIRLL